MRSPHNTQQATQGCDIIQLIQSVLHQSPHIISLNTHDLWQTLLKEEGGTVITASDAINRPRCVELQALVESNLATALKFGKIEAVIGVIHTKLPATPLRTDGTKLEGVVAKEILQDPAQLKSVSIRPPILRRYLQAGGTLIAAYPNTSLASPIPGMEVYRSLLGQFPNLMDAPLDRFSDEYTGATYLIQEKSGKISCFSIMAAQASSATTEGKMGVWCGSLSLPKIRERFNQIDGLLKPQGIDLIEKLHSLAPKKTPSCERALTL